MKCNVYVSFSLFILIDTPIMQYLLPIMCRKVFVYKDGEMYVMFELMKFDLYTVDM